MENNVDEENDGSILVAHEVTLLLQNILRDSEVVRDGASDDGQSAGEQEVLPESLDTLPDGPNHRSMNDLTREEMDAKLAATEARMDARVASIEGKIDGLLGVLNERFKSMDERMGRIETDSRDTKSAVSSLKSTMIVTGIGTVLTIVLGVAAFNATVLSNMVATFESGKSTAAAQAEVKRQAEETAELLRQIRAEPDRAAPSGAAR